ncbi:hypothetical protein BCR35DRAFT_87350 [Leucosporidium creatinivorum]|uniref:Uncharacterized protein n=1 Tax=Leucosporidium creatinivorum TaxID=106004 RepID=A0A1Y2FBK0_9BASI|nr:hypothetical protein BCR35DRAFT_87350 [Leucosporidium creatinivorum]
MEMARRATKRWMRMIRIVMVRSLILFGRSFIVVSGRRGRGARGGGERPTMERTSEAEGERFGCRVMNRRRSTKSRAADIFSCPLPLSRSLLSPSSAALLSHSSHHTLTLTLYPSLHPRRDLDLPSRPPLSSTPSPSLSPPPLSSPLPHFSPPSHPCHLLGNNQKQRRTTTATTTPMARTRNLISRGMARAGEGGGGTKRERWRAMMRRGGS